MSDILTKEQSRMGIQNGINRVADTVALTAGPKGRNVVIAQEFGASRVTNDGVTVARSISLDDPLEDIGAHMVKEVATNTEIETGDGTSTSAILLQALVSGGMKMLAAGADPNMLKIGMFTAANTIADELDKMSTPVTGNEMLKRIATIASNNDSELGEHIAEAFHMAGDGGQISVSESGNSKTSVELVEGLNFDRGWIHRAFVTHPKTMTAEMGQARVLVTDKRIHTTEAIIGIIEQVTKSETPEFIIISDDIDDGVAQAIAMSHTMGVIKIVCIKAPGYGVDRADRLEDIAAIVGANFIGVAREINTITLDDLGTVDKAVVGKDESTLIGGYGDSDNISDRIENIKEQLKDSKLEDHPKKVLESRLSYLTGGVVVLRIGANSDTELEEKKFRIEDAIGATKSAISEGVVPGGGVALMRIVSSPLTFDTDGDPDIEMGAKVVLKAVEGPFRKILENASLSPDQVLNTILSSEDKFFGMNVRTGEYGSTLELGVLDPVKVTKSALLNATSVAAMFLTTDAVIFQKPL